MTDWIRCERGGLPLCQAAPLSALPGIVHGFTTRQGGVSRPPYASLNLGTHVADNPTDVQTNRARLWNTLGFAEDQVSLAEQVHGDNVAVVTRGGPPVPGVDALITETPNLLLMLFFADCVPVYLIDPAARSIGLIHAGWRGTVAGIVPGTLAALEKHFGSRPSLCRAAIGPCIGGDSYEIGADVAGQVRGAANGMSGALTVRDEIAGTVTLDLRRVIFEQLLCAGLPAENIAACREDTFRNERDFFSFRRDRGHTGRMAAYLALT